MAFLWLMLLPAHSPSHLFGWMKNWWTEQSSAKWRWMEREKHRKFTTIRRRRQHVPSYRSHRTHISFIAIRGRDKIKAKGEKEEKSSSTLHRLSQSYLIISPFFAVRHTTWEGWKTHFTIFFHSLKRNDAKNCVLFSTLGCEKAPHVRVWDFTHDVYNQ